MAILSTKSARTKLEVRREPHWTQIGRGAYLGYRAGANTWIVRYRDHDGDQHYQSLGELEEFTDAKTRAERWLSQITHGARRAPSRGTVRDALGSYVRHLRSVGRRNTAWEVGQRFRLTVGRTSEFGRMKLEGVMREDVEAWRNNLRKGRKPRSVNRQVRAVVAALNFAVSHGHTGRREAWELEHLIDEGEENVAVFLTADQRDRLIAAAPKNLASLLSGFTHTGARPSELARAVVEDFDPKGGTVTLRHRKGRGTQVKSRAVQLSDEGIEFFKSQARRKLPKAALISNDEGTHWTDQQWCDGIASTITAVNKAAKKPVQRIPAGASAYSFRHTRISELLQVFKIDPLTTAQQTGTSVAMIAKYYFKFISSAMREKLNAVKESA
jgi:integrase